MFKSYLVKTRATLVVPPVLSFVQQACKPLCKSLFLCAFAYGFYFLFCVYLPGAQNFRGILSLWAYLKRVCQLAHGSLLLKCVWALVLLPHHLFLPNHLSNRPPNSCASGTSWTQNSLSICSAGLMQLSPADAQNGGSVVKLKMLEPHNPVYN